MPAHERKYSGGVVHCHGSRPDIINSLSCQHVICLCHVPETFRAKFLTVANKQQISDYSVEKCLSNEIDNIIMKSRVFVCILSGIG